MLTFTLTMAYIRKDVAEVSMNNEVGNFFFERAKNILDVTSCSHHRCAEYFRESIKSTVGFYGWPCSSLIQLFLGQCHSPYDNKELLLAGEHCDASLRGMFVVETNSKAPFAKGRNHLMASETVPRTTPDESESTKVPHDFLSAQQDVQRSRLEASTFLINKFGEITENR